MKGTQEKKTVGLGDEWAVVLKVIDEMPLPYLPFLLMCIKITVGISTVSQVI